MCRNGLLLRLIVVVVIVVVSAVANREKVKGYEMEVGATNATEEARIFCGANALHEAGRMRTKKVDESDDRCIFCVVLKRRRDDVRRKM